MHKFNASFYIGDKFNQTERDTAAEAIADVEAAGEGSVVKFALYPNLAGCLPEYRHTSLALWTYVNDKWEGRSIFGASSEVMGEDKPS